jgi:hypothetical protein
MHRTLAILSSLAAVIGALGCSSSSPAPAAGPSCATATVSFKTDVVPVFEKGCTLSAVCHGQMNNATEEDLYLGENAGGTNAATVYSMLVGVKAKELPTMNLVTASDLDNSFLWQKINGPDGLAALGSQCMMAPKQCTDCSGSTPCGSTMPYPGGTIDPGYKCTIQNWIQGGALNN